MITIKAIQRNFPLKLLTFSISKDFMKFKNVLKQQKMEQIV